jgi:hypothetical protein
LSLGSTSRLITATVAVLFDLLVMGIIVETNGRSGVGSDLHQVPFTEDGIKVKCHL